ncbi:MAG: SoxR reducing system RseC family protein [Desulfobacterales bacterium]|nr:SoxR reducing system RseC family protein [Desulfobacterales bacterium]
MPDYEGFVASITADRKAEVIISPGVPGIPGAPEVSAKVCHCPTDGSSVTIEALNRAGAGVGDLVCISRTPGVLIKNAAALLGIPALGAILGLAAGARFAGRGAIAFTAVGLLLGIIVGAAIYRRLSVHNQPVISRVIRTRTQMASRFSANQSCFQDQDPTCRSCIQRLP